MHSLTKLQSTPFSVLFFCLCDGFTPTERIRSFVLTQSHQIIITQNHWIQIDNVLLSMIMIDRNVGELFIVPPFERQCSYIIYMYI